MAATVSICFLVISANIGNERTVLAISSAIGIVAFFIFPVGIRFLKMHGNWIMNPHLDAAVR